MLKILLVAILPFLFLFGNPKEEIAPTIGPSADTGTLQKMVAESGTLTLNVDLQRLGAGTARAQKMEAQLDVEANSMFTVLVFNDELRGPLPSSMGLVPRNGAALVQRLNASRLTLESMPWGGQSDLAVRDAETGFAYFYVEGHVFEFNAEAQALVFQPARLLLSTEYASRLGRPGDAGIIVGEIAFEGKVRTSEITQVVEGETVSGVMPARRDGEAGTVPGPDVIVGDLSGLAQFGNAGTQVGLAVGTDSCNAGTIELNWFANPGSNDHPVIPQNLYRMSGGTTNDERFEQIGQSHVKHAFTALQNNICGFGCVSSGTGTRLGSGCSDPYGAGLNSGPNLGSRAWINPFTGFFPVGSGNNNHSGHSHTGTSHRILTEITDLNTTLNIGASYFAEAQYVTPHEYAWCQANPGQCNMYNNVSYRKYNVSGTTGPFSFSPGGSTQRMRPAIQAWTGATQVDFHPVPGQDGTGTVAYKVTNTAPGVWHYEYAVYNQNLDRAIQSFTVPVGNGVIVTNIGFHAPPQHPGWAADGTQNSAGYSSAPWTPVQNGSSITWSTETFAQNQNANAIRWGTMYNFRFDATAGPAPGAATLGFFKTGDPINLQVAGPAGVGTPTPTATPTNTPTSTPTATPTATPVGGWEGDVAPRPSGDGGVNSSDVIQLRRFATALDTPNPATNEAQRADIAPLATSGDGSINAGDVTQGRRFATGLDPVGPAGGPGGTAASGESRYGFISDLYDYFFGREVRLGAANNVDGRIVVPVEIIPHGGEAALGFTLEYDASLLANPRVDLGEWAPAGAVITTNASTPGRIAVLIDAAAAMRQADSPKTFALVSFDAVPGAVGESKLAFTGTLAPRSIANADGNLVSARYFDTTLSVGHGERGL